jgi:hypothetical protein
MNGNLFSGEKISEFNCFKYAGNCYMNDTKWVFILTKEISSKGALGSE